MTEPAETVLSMPPDFGDDGFAHIDGRAFLELAETGWDALIAEAAGRDRLRLARHVVADHTVRTIFEHGDQTRTVTSPRTSGDQDDIDGAIDEHLTEAGRAPRPRGYRWFLAVPPGISDPTEFSRRVNVRFAELTGTAPDAAEAYAALAVIIEELYADETPA
ncbi:DUF5956 family protein [Glycomyces paridis]|uniref:Uncharacterized protein n=1 Tax=Glycomyces paridis TaxID=2126555 RepID=A0A4S8P2E0_9ACTN|nr:DUF5956 family protein [Glycomyces paridis]THV21719.1 hypothetical protein E9998_24480 [Glycomyces paridis]